MHQRTLSRTQFDGACKALVAKYESVETNIKGLKGWSWKEHPSVPRLGYLSRTIWLSRKQKTRNGLDLEELSLLHNQAEPSEDDPASVSLEEQVNALSCCQYIVYSASFQVPAFYFTVHDLSGSPLTLEEMLEIPLFKPSAFECTETTPYSISLPSAPFPLLSQGDHPTTGLPCWYFHPCNTSSAVEELMTEVEKDICTGGNELIRWLEVWSMIVGTMVDWTE